MTWITKAIFHFVFLVGTLTFVTPFPKLWTFDLLNLTTTTTNPQMVDLDMHIVRLGRGTYGFSGFVDIKQEFGDEVTVSVIVKRSLNKDGPYSILPYVESEVLSVAINRYYKTLIMPSAEKCCTNAPVFKGAFVMPLTPRHVEINTCILSVDNLPSIMMEGYYWISIKLRCPLGQEVNVMFQTYVESK